MAAAKVVPVELGCLGHFVCASRCRWRRHTQVGAYRVSSVGDYYYAEDGGGKDKRQTVGAGDNDFFETMVFKTTRAPYEGRPEDCGCREVKAWGELECKRYATAGEAQQGHERYITEYLALSRRRAPKEMTR